MSDWHGVIARVSATTLYGRRHCPCFLGMKLRCKKQRLQTHTLTEHEVPLPLTYLQEVLLSGLLKAHLPVLSPQPAGLRQASPLTLSTHTTGFACAVPSVWGALPTLLPQATGQWPFIRSAFAACQLDKLPVSSALLNTICNFLLHTSDFELVSLPKHLKALREYRNRERNTSGFVSHYSPLLASTTTASCVRFTTDWPGLRTLLGLEQALDKYLLNK